MSDDMQEFNYLRGMLSFRLPSAWTCSWDPENKQAIFYQDRPNAGVLRLALAKVLHYDPAMSLDEFARDLTGSGDINDLGNGNILVTKTEQFDFDGVDYLLFSWYHMHNAPPVGAQVACFMYQASFQEMQDPDSHFQISMLNQEIANCQWSDLGEFYSRIRPVISQKKDLNADTVNYPISEQVSMGLATVDSAGHFEFMSEGDIENLGLNTDSAWQSAFSNMNFLIESTPPEVELVANRVPVVCFSPEIYDQASLITAPGLKQVIEPHLGWPVMAIFPCRDFLHIFPANWQPTSDQEKVLARTVLEEYQNSQDKLSTELFRIDEEGIQSVGTFTASGLQSGSESTSEVDALVSSTYPSPQTGKDYYNRGLVYSSMMEHQKAIREFSAAIDLEPNVPEYYKSRAQEYSNIGSVDEAADDTRMANQLGRRRRR